MVPLSQQNSQNRRETVKFSGVFIAPVTPMDSSGRVALPLWDDLIGYLLDAGVDGLCVGGATSEYVHFDPGERKELMHCAAAGLKGRGRLFASIGASTYRHVLELGKQAAEEGADAALVPMPHFFRYQQVDLEHFCREVSRNLPLPCLLYNLPGFTNPLELETTVRLLQEAPGIVGIKDSGGDSEALARYPEACRDARDTTSLMVGKDIRIYDGLSLGWDGCVSGLGNICPELVVELYRSFQSGDRPKAKACQEQICRLFERVFELPFPWAIRLGLEVRGLNCGPLALPLAAERKKQAADFQQWYRDWLATDLPVLVNSIVSAVGHR